MKLQHIAAAVALAVAGSANAAVDQFSTGNSSFFLVAYDNAGGSFTQTASLFDLGFNLNDIAGATGNAANGALGTLAQAGTNVVWNFNTNTVTINGTVASIGTNDWSGNFAKLVANSDAGQIRWTVGAADSTGILGDQRYLITGQPNASALSTQNGTNTTGLAGSAGLLNNTNVTSKGTLSSADNGAWTFAATAGDGAATAANGYVIDSTIFGTGNWRTKNVLTTPTVLDGAQQNLWLADATGNEIRLGQLPVGQTVPGFLNNSTTLVFNSVTGTLTMSTPAVPEPSTYAMALVGLALAGVVARRRRA